MAHNVAPVGSGRPSTRRTSVIESPAPSSISASSVSKSDKMKSVKEVSVSKDSKSNESKEKESKEGEESKIDVAAEYNKFRADLGKMLKESEDKMSNMLKESETRMSDKLNKIENNFSVKIEGLRKEMKSEMNEIKEEIENTKSVVNEEVSTMKETVSDMEKSVQDNSDRMLDIEKSQEEKIEAATAKLDVKIEELDTKLKLLEKQDRKYNLLFYGFTEEAGEDVYNVVRQSLITDLKLDEERVRNMYFAAGHRVPTKAAGPKPIIIRCTSLEDRELILSQSKNYGGLRKRVVVDWPKDMKEERSRLAKIAYEIRKSEDKHTRIKDKGLDVILEVRNNASDKWVKRVV